MKKLLIAIIFISVVGLGLEFAWLNYFSSPGTSSNLEIFVVPETATETQIVDSLYEKKLIKNKPAFRFLLSNFFLYSINPGGYRISRDMNSWEVMQVLHKSPELLWFTVSFCARKEQIGEKLSETLGWDQSDLDKWNNSYPLPTSEYFEGVYYPDTYLLPIYESGDQIAQRFIRRFNEKLTPLKEEMENNNITWTTALKVASLIARESAGGDDMSLVSGIIWKRLNIEMPLQIDATMQYTYGKNEDGTWWGPIDLAQKRAKSPYNTYLFKGLPPTPICSPNIDAIKAAINPVETDCLFYLHDMFRQIHCAKTYEEHKENIEKYLTY